MTGPDDGIPGLRRTAALALAPRFAGPFDGAQLASEVAPFERVLVVLRRLDGSVLKDTLVDFPANADTIDLTITVNLPLNAGPEGITLALTLRYIDAVGDTVFSGGPITVQAVPTTSGEEPTPVDIPVVFTGTGANATSVLVTPNSGTVIAGTTTQFSGIARDASNAIIASTPILFSTPDGAQASVTAGGLATWLPVRGPARIIGALLNGADADTVTLSVILPASQLLTVSGDEQSGIAGAPLPDSLLLRVAAADGVGSVDKEVVFTVTTGAGSLTALKDTSDADGLVSTKWTLGTPLGAQSVTATVTGVAGATRVLTAMATAGTPVRLEITAEPSATHVAGATLAPALTVRAVDAGGNTVTNFTGEVVAGLAVNPGGASLSGASNVNAVAGIATFPGLAVQKAAAGYALGVTSGELVPDTTSAFEITTAAAGILSSVSGNGQTGTANTPLAAPFVVLVTDDFGNPVSGVTVTWVVAVGGGSMSAPTSVTDASGRASSTFTLPTGSGGLSTVEASVAGLSGSPVIFTANTEPGPAAIMEFGDQPALSVAAGASLGTVLITTRDALTNLAPYVGDITLTLTGGDPAAALSGTTQMTVVNSTVTFTDLSVDSVGTGYQLVATAPGLANAFSATFDVVGGAPATLGLVSGDAQTAPAGAPLAAPIVVRVADSQDNALAGVPVIWTVIQPSPLDTILVDTLLTSGDGTIGLAPTMPSVAGSAQVVASVAGLPDVTVLATVVHAEPFTLVMVNQPSNTTAGATAPAHSVLARDAFGNVATTFNTNVNVVVDSGPAGGTIGGTTNLIASSGVADFTATQFSIAGTYRLRYTSAGLNDAVSSTFVVSAGPPSLFEIVAGNGQSGPASQPLADSLVVRLRDTFGNPIAGANVSFTVPSGGGTASPVIVPTDAAGLAATELTLGATLGAWSVDASSAGVSAVTFSGTTSATTANIVWTGAVSASYEDGANWTGGVVPVATDSVRIAAGTPNSPVMGASASVSRLTLDAGASLDMGAQSLVVLGSLDVGAGASLTTTGTTNLLLSGTGFIRGPLPAVVLQGGAYTMAGGVDVSSDLQVINGSLLVSSFDLTVAGNLTVSGPATLAMTGPATITVAGATYLAGANTSGLLTGGTLVALGDFTTVGAQAFMAGPAHTVELAGAAAQTVHVDLPDLEPVGTCTNSCFGTLRSLRGAGQGVVTFTSSIKTQTALEITGDGIEAAGHTLLGAGTPNLTAASVVAGKVGWQTGLDRSATFMVDSLIAWGATGALLAGEVIPTRITGNYTLTGPHPASISVDGSLAPARLDIVGAASIGTGTGDVLYTVGDGYLRMQDAADSLVVNGNIHLQGTTPLGELTAGVLELTGNFLQSLGGVRSYVASVTHRTRLIGAAQSLFMSDNTLNSFGTFDLAGTTAKTFVSGATITGDVTLQAGVSVVGGDGVQIGGSLADPVGARWQVVNTLFLGSDPSLPATINGNIGFQQGITLDAPLTVNGNIGVAGGVLSTNAQRLVVNGDLGTAGTGSISMISAADTIVVTGEAAFGGGSTEGLVTAGRLELLGNFSATQPGSFVASGTHETWFVGTLSQTVLFSNPGYGAGQQRFARLGAAQDAVGIGVQLLTDAFAEGEVLNLPAQSRRFIGAGQRTLTTRGANLTGVQFEAVALSITDGGPITALDSLGFAFQDPTVAQLTIARSNGTFSLSNVLFDTTPTTGRYLVANDVSGAGDGLLSIAVSNPTPFLHNGFISELNGATITGWTDFAALNWTGATSSVWTDAANWAENRTPTPGDSVFVPAGTTFAPAIPAVTTLRALVSQNLSGVTLNGPLTITERLRVPITGGMQCSGASLSFGGAGAQQVSGLLDQCFVRVVAGAVTAVDSTLVVGQDLQVESGSSLDVGTTFVSVGGNFATMSGGRLLMQNSTGHLFVENGATFDGASSEGELTGGTLEIGGNFTQGGTSSFRANADHITRFFDNAFGGIGARGVAIADEVNTSFGSIELASFSRDVTTRARVVRSLRMAAGTSIVGTGAVDVADSLVVPGGSSIVVRELRLQNVVNAQGTWAADSIFFYGVDQLMPNAGSSYAHVIVSGTVTFVSTEGASVIVGGNLSVRGNGQLRVGLPDSTTNLTVSGTFATFDNGTLRMSDPNTELQLNGTALFHGGSTVGLLTDGSLTLRGNFVQGTNAEAFAASGLHATQFAGSTDQTVNFANPGAAAGTSHFADLRVGQNGSVISVQLLSDVTAVGQLRNGDGSLRRLTAAAPRALTTHGSDANGYQFLNVRWALREGAAINAIDNVTFSGMDVAHPSYFDIERNTGPVTTTGMTFGSTPSGGGVYVRAADANGAGDGLLVLDMPSTSPTFHGGLVTLVNGATITSWGEFPSFVWTGINGGDWNDPNNWSSGLVPTATDSVHIPNGTGVTPQQFAPVTIRALVNEDTSLPVQVENGGALTITERFVSTYANPGVICIGSNLQIAPTTTSTIRGNIGCTIEVIGSVPTLITDSLQVNQVRVSGTGVLDINGGRVVVVDSLVTESGGRLEMTDVKDTVIVGFDAEFRGGSTNDLLTAGLLQVGRHFTQGAGDPAAFAAGPGHRTRITGLSSHTVNFANPGATTTTSHFGTLEVAGEGQTIDLNGDVVALGQIVSAAASTATFGGVVPRLLMVEGVDVSSVTFDAVRLRIGAGAALTKLDGITFQNQQSDQIQLEVIRPDGALVVNSIAFNSVPTVGGAYLRVDDTNEIDGQQLTLTMVSALPTSHGGAIILDGGALLGWPEFPPAPPIVWTNASLDNNWGNIANWDLGRLPVATDSVVIDGDGNPYTINLNTSATVGWLVVGTNGSMTLNHTSSTILQVDSVMFMPAGADLVMTSGSTITGEGAMLLGGAFTWSGGTLSGNGGTLIMPGATASIAATNTVTLDTRILSIGGTATVGDAGITPVNSPAITTEPGGLLNFQAPISLFPNATEATIVNAGTMQVGAAGNTVRIDWAILNTGTIQVVSGTLDLRNALSHISGTVDVQGTATLLNGGETAATGAFTIAETGTMTLQSGGVSANAGNHIFAAGSSISGAGTVRVNSADTTRFQGSLDIDSLTVQNGNTWFESADTMFVTNGAYLGGGFFRGTGVLGIRGDFVLGAGNIVGTGTMKVRAGGSLELRGMTGWAVDVEGTAYWRDYDMTFGHDTLSGVPYSSVTVRTGALLEIQHGATTPRELFGRGATTGEVAIISVESGGTIRKTTGTGESNIRPRVLLSGQFDIQAGSINVQGSCSVTGGSLITSGGGTLTGNFSPTGGCVIP